MIESIQIKNFKSVVDLSLELGTFNVLIGENGCGKSNILEAIAFGAAASADKLDFEFLGSRGIRLTNPEFMFSAFVNIEKIKVIFLKLKFENKNLSFNLIQDSKNPKKWTEKRLEKINKKISKIYSTAEEEIDLIISAADPDERHIQGKKKAGLLKDRLEELKENLKKDIFSTIPDAYQSTLRRLTRPYISNFIIFSPEQSSLRKYEETNQIYPLGIKGEGLLQYLKELALDEKNKETLVAIKENLMLLDWYEDFDLPDNVMRNEYSLKIKDKYLDENLQYFDQRSTNEGFLFLLFYSTLFISKDTPTFFAIDNIDTSFNPKLCMQLTKNLAALAKKYNKQVIVTTHNPAILDGLDLEDNDQRLFVIRRNEEGYSKAKRIEYKAERTMKLSEVWTNGFIGGLPENF